jgi:hypothetical protein
MWIVTPSKEIVNLDKVDDLNVFAAGPAEDQGVPVLGLPHSLVARTILGPGADRQIAHVIFEGPRADCFRVASLIAKAIASGRAILDLQKEGSPVDNGGRAG